MRKTMLAAVAAAVLATPAAPAFADSAMEKLVKDKGCTACHANDKKLIGPAYKDVAKKYKGDAAAPAKLAEKVIKGGQGVWGPIPMPPNKVTDDEAKKMVAYVLAM
ncbi:MAG: c-type cytochrome [Betaproteobacteria bacterium]|nr:c-type cytochrome [Betaproteobacteria bacterium]MCC7215835.1 c-type cytochrome [Burkholderiales bacterium]